MFLLKAVPFIDITGLDTLQEMIENYQRQAVKIYLCEVNEKVKHKLDRVCIPAALYRFDSLPAAINDSMTTPNQLD